MFINWVGVGRGGAEWAGRYVCMYDVVGVWKRVAEYPRRYFHWLDVTVPSRNLSLRCWGDMQPNKLVGKK
jgi:hypothetical protein